MDLTYLNSQVSASVNRDPDYLLARYQYIQESKNKITNGQYYISNNVGGSRQLITYHSIETIDNRYIKELFKYNDEYNHTRYFTIYTKMLPVVQIATGINDPIFTFWSQVYETDNHGNRVSSNNRHIRQNIFVNYGVELIDTHYASVFDLDFRSYDYVLNQYDNYSDEDDVIDNNEYYIDDSDDYHINYQNNLINKINSLEQIHNGLCSICLDDNNTTNLIKTDCNHTFHNDCIMSWINTKLDNYKCPNCRTEL
jgi:hypothetical protein